MGTLTIIGIYYEMSLTKLYAGNNVAGENGKTYFSTIQTIQIILLR